MSAQGICEAWEGGSDSLRPATPSSRYLAERAEELAGLRQYRTHSQLTGREAARMICLEALLPMIHEHQRGEG